MGKSFKMFEYRERNYSGPNVSVKFLIIWDYRSKCQFEVSSCSALG